MFKAEDALWVSRTDEIEPRLYFISRNTGMIVDSLGRTNYKALCGITRDQWWGSDGNVPFCSHCAHIAGRDFLDLNILSYSELLDAISFLGRFGYPEASEKLKEYFDSRILSGELP